MGHGAQSLSKYHNLHLIKRARFVGWISKACKSAHPASRALKSQRKGKVEPWGRGAGAEWNR
jgi:hypothetical protein